MESMLIFQGYEHQQSIYPNEGPIQLLKLDGVIKLFVD